MVKSSNITVTDHRLANAIKKGNTVANKNAKSVETVKEEVEQNVKLKLAKVLKYYPETDKAVIEFVETGKTARCVVGHSAISPEVLTAYTPQGNLQWDETFKEHYIPPVNPYYCLVLDIRKRDNLKEQCIVCFVSTDSMKIPETPQPGEYSVAVLNSSLVIRNDSIIMRTPKFLINDKEIISTTTGYVTNEELEERLTNFKTELLEEINEGTV